LISIAPFLGVVGTGWIAVSAAAGLAAAIAARPPQAASMRRRVIITSPERLPAATAMRDDGTRRLVGFAVAFSFGDVLTGSPRRLRRI
jgi:hypothetical protein